MSEYYYLVAGLPDVHLDDSKLSYTVENFKSELYPQLSDNDKKVIDLFYLQFDNKALLHLLRNKESEISGKGNFNKSELLDCIETVQNGDQPDSKFPSYFNTFLTYYFSLQSEERKIVEMSDFLQAAYYTYAMQANNSFCAAWFEFNLNINNILAALNARKYNIPVGNVIVGDTDICHQLKTSNARDFGLSDTLVYFENLSRIAESEHLLNREKNIDMLKWKWLEEESFFHYFSVERLFVFLLQLEMTERWMKLDKDKGHELFRSLINGLKNDVQIPQEFRK